MIRSVLLFDNHTVCGVLILVQGSGSDDESGTNTDKRRRNSEAADKRKRKFGQQHNDLDEQKVKQHNDVCVTPR